MMKTFVTRKKEKRGPHERDEAFCNEEKSRKKSSSSIMQLKVRFWRYFRAFGTMISF